MSFSWCELFECLGVPIDKCGDAVVATIGSVPGAVLGGLLSAGVAYFLLSKQLREKRRDDDAERIYQRTMMEKERNIRLAEEKLAHDRLKLFASRALKPFIEDVAATTQMDVNAEALVRVQELLKVRDLCKEAVYLSRNPELIEVLYETSIYLETLHRMLDKVVNRPGKDSYTERKIGELKGEMSLKLEKVPQDILPSIHSFENSVIAVLKSESPGADKD